MPSHTYLDYIKTHVDDMPSHTYLDYIKTHVDDMLGASAVVSGSGVALQGVAEVTAVKVMISKVIMTPPVGVERMEAKHILKPRQEPEFPPMITDNISKLFHDFSRTFDDIFMTFHNHRLSLIIE